MTHPSRSDTEFRPIVEDSINSFHHSTSGGYSRITETADHAWALRDFLPNWPVRDGMPEMNDEAAWTLPKPVPGHIATLMYAYRYRIPCDILVRASAGTGSLDWDSAGDVRLLDGKPALILDIADVSHPHDKVDVEVRTKEYAEQGLRRRIIDVPNETH